MDFIFYTVGCWNRLDLHVIAIVFLTFQLQNLGIFFFAWGGQGNSNHIKALPLNRKHGLICFLRPAARTAPQKLHFSEKTCHITEGRSTFLMIHTIACANTARVHASTKTVFSVDSSRADIRRTLRQICP